MTVGKFVYFICSQWLIENNNMVIYFKLCQPNYILLIVTSYRESAVLLKYDVSIYVITNVINVP